MKNKWFMLVLLVLFIVPQTFAQMRRRVESTVSIGLTAGAGLTKFTGTDYFGEKLGYKFIVGYKGGAHVNIPSAPDLYFQPGLELFVKGAKQEIINDDISKTTRLLYLELPLNMLYRPKMNDGHALLGLGPFAAFGLVGKEKVQMNDVSSKLNVRFLTDASDQPTTYAYYKGLDLGLNAFIGYEFFNGFSVQLNGQLGLLKANSDYNLANDKTSKKNMGFGVSMGYRFTL